MKTKAILTVLAFSLGLYSCQKKVAEQEVKKEELTLKGKSVATTPPAPAGTTWQLVESDDFNSLDLNRWGHGGTPWGSESHDGSCNLQTASNSFVSGGALVVQAKKGPFTGPSGKSYPYSGDYVWTKTRRTYGYLEIRAQYPDARGVWPAFWMLGDGWPPEIDIAEFRGTPKNYMTHAYYDGSWSSTTTSGNFTGWHTYGLLWQPGSLKFYIDDVLKATVTKSSVPSVPMYVILSNGADCGDANGTGFPNDYKVDYFRWYQSVPSGGLANGTYTISNRNSNKCLTLLNGSQNDGTNIVQYNCDGNNNSKWVVSQVSSGVYTIVNKNNSKYAEVAGWSTTPGGNVDIWPNSGGNNQRWNIISVGSGYYKIKNVHSGMVMDISGASTANNAADVQWGDSGGNNQQWKFTSAP
ncbi:RICIN domain-containing protein [Pedobacter miscanthi]|uniref:GH16 domain-containing protein n=1 Tax=Pedobacter miscanthi TaxID=2259170 RepID=A0A366L916_9SPHI|nr:RICIN domain-containing protein [Pedobacter miscanthi]RBQ09973.1 hypothetical protein DRW42_05920 [Pedobacter miscanthi]